MRRREFITLLGGAAAAWPLAARAQQPERRRRIAVLMPFAADEPESLARIGAFLQGLQALGWTEGRNVRIEYRWATNDADRRKAAADLVALAPDIILANGASTLGPLLQVTRTLPIVFVQLTDPVGAGFVASLARPGGNATGFTTYEYSLSGKWLELLKEMAPAVKRTLVLRDPSIASGIGQFAAIQAIAPSLKMDIISADVREASEIERAVTTFSDQPNGGLIVLTGVPTIIHHKLIIALAAQHRLPAVYPFRMIASDGGLCSYGPDSIEPFRSAAGYVDRILRGEKPGDLPVQAPTKLELVLNLKTAKALALDVPATLLARADEVIE
jgi:putative ABC transport system substrate-binding protein